MTKITKSRARLVADIVDVPFTRSELNFLVPLLKDVYYDYGFNDAESRPDRRSRMLQSITATLDKARKKAS